jgi:hypothetical protein
MTCEAIHCFGTATVRFAIYPDGLDGPRIVAEISEHALRSLVAGCDGGESLLRACQAHFTLIEAKALARYRSNPVRPVSLGSDDFAMPAAFAGLTDV